jgi:multidrug efflux pump subunit AcrA (membrane-fusion protein)
MAETNDNGQTPAPDPASTKTKPDPGPSFARRILGFLIALAAVAVAGGATAYWMMNRPRPDRRPREKQATLVVVRAVEKARHEVTITALGTVMPSRETRIAALVAGEVVDVREGFVPGGRCDANALLLEVDPTDYRLAVRQARATLAQADARVVEAESLLTQRKAAITQARTQLALEKAQGQVARREYELLGEEMDPNDERLVLRVPQREAAEAAVAVAEAAKASAEASLKAARSNRDVAEVALDQALLNLTRTKVRAPFNALIRERHVDLGGRVVGEGAVATVAGTDEWWVEVSVPVDQLQWLNVPGFNARSSSPARVYYEAAWGRDAFRQGQAARLRGALEPRGRMAQLLVAVPDPMGLQQEPDTRRALLLNSYVRVELVGRETPPAVRVERTSLRDGDSVWVMSADDTLEIRPVTVVLGQDEAVYVSAGLEDGDRLVTSDIATPVEGMPLRLASKTTTRSGAGDDE